MNLSEERRKRIKSIIEQINQLNQIAPIEPNDWEVWRKDILELINQDIKFLSKFDIQSPHIEGNGCELLRQIRDTLLSTTSQKYIDHDTRQSVVNLLSSIGLQDKLTGTDVSFSADFFDELGLDPCCYLSDIFNLDIFDPDFFEEW